jgi:crotonobetainyl-CoA:carnitine CoA-transferase CaiB-like acyl-CoA transferase
VSDPSLPLSGLTVVSCEQAVAAPMATRHLADLGARVIKVERPGTGDFARQYDETVKGLSSHFVWLNRSKESLTLDLKQPAAVEVMHRLLERADVFVENFAPGAIERIGLGPAAVTAAHPHVVYCSISGYGSAGPYRDAKAYDLLIQAEAGLVSITGTPDDPAKAGIPTADIAAGMYAFSGILAALLDRHRTGRGRVVEISLFDSLAEWMGYPMYWTQYGGTAPARAGASHAAIAPYGPFAAADGDVVLAIQNEREWLSFCTNVLERPETATDPRFATNSARVANRTDLHAAIDATIGALPVDEVVARLAAARIAYARMNDVHGLVAHPQLSSRGRWREVDSSVGPIAALLPPITYPGLEPRMDPIPEVGQHNDPILESLGYSADEVRDLHTDGVV